MTIFNAIDNGSYKNETNTVLGKGSLSSLVGATNTTGVGSSSLSGVIDSIHNTACGSLCLANINGDGNTAIGYECGTSNATGKYNIYVGHQAAINHSDNFSSNIIIGNEGAIIAENNTIKIGKSGNGDKEQDDCYIAAISTNEIVDLTGLKIVTVNPSDDNIQCVDPAGLLEATLITTHDTPGAFAWTMNPRTKYIRVYGWNGGNGGGSGYMGVNNESGGAAGGSAGSCFIAEGPATFFSSVVGGVVGAGGVGGASIPYTAGSDVPGNDGGTGGVSEFGAFYVPNYVPGGQGGIKHGGSTAAAGNRAVSFLGFFSQAGKGGTGNLGSGGHGVDAGPLTGNIMMGTGGGGGAGTYGDLTYVGGNGGSIYAGDGVTLILSGGGGGDPGPTPIGDGAIGNAGTLIDTGMIVGGTGGGGGAGLSTTIAGTAGKGGNGAFPGGGGGGGAGGENSSSNINSGPGGDGGNGRVIIVEFF